MVDFPMIIQFDLSTRFYALLGRIADSLESIDRTLKAQPEDFSTEDNAVNQAAKMVAEAKERIPHGT
jgi:hypothetical protein